MIRDRGEPDRVSLRGASSNLVATQIDGERLPAPNGELRTAGLANVPFDLVTAVEVVKGFVPEREADAVGGAVNLVTAVPRYEATQLRLGLGAQDLSGGASGALGAARTQRWMEGKLGLLLAISARQDSAASDRLERRFVGDRLERFELRDFSFGRRRAGGLAHLELAPSERVSILARTFSSQGRIQEFRRRVKNDLVDLETERELKESVQLTRLSSQRLFGSRTIGGRWYVSGQLVLLTAREEEPDRIDTSFIDDQVSISPSARALDEDPDSFTLDKIGVEVNRSKDETWMLAGEATFLPAPETPWRELKVGLKTRRKSRWQDTNSTHFEPTREILLGSWLDGVERSLFRGRYPLGPMMGANQARGLLSTGVFEGQGSLEEEAGDFQALEETVAGFLQTRLALGEWGEILAGMRYETTGARYTGYEVVTGEESGELRLSSLPGTATHSETLPMAVLRARPTGTVTLEATVARSFSRPNYYDLAPYSLIDREDEVIERGNPLLRPARAWNYDIGAEWRSSPALQVRASAFRKSITDFTFSSVRREELMGSLFEVYTPENGSLAHLSGLELRLDLTALASRDQELRLQLELSQISSSADIASRAEYTRLPGQASGSLALGLSYQRGPAQVGLWAKYAGSALSEIGAAAQDDVVLGDESRLDLSVTWKVWRDGTAHMDVLNLTDSSSRFFQGASSRVRQQDLSGRSVRLGFSISF